MDSDFVRSVALLWRRILLQDPAQLFGSEAHRLLQRNWGDQFAQPGYVGRSYSLSGLTFVSMNPGGGPNEGLGAGDLAQYRILQTLRDASEADAPMAFEKLTALLAEMMPTWKIIRNFVLPYAHVDFNQVAYVNLLKWRTTKSNGLAPLYGLSWQHHTGEQLSLLEPSVVVAIGSNAGKAFRCHYRGDAHLDAIPRVIGNNIGTEGRLALERIKDWFERHPLRSNRPPANLRQSTRLGRATRRLQRDLLKGRRKIL